MGRQSIKALVIMILIAFLSGLGVLLYASWSPSFSYSILSNLDSNRDYYDNLTAEFTQKDIKETTDQQQDGS